MRLIEKYIQVVRESGLNTARPVDFSQSPSVKLPSNTTVAGVTINGGGLTNPDTSASANALTVGPNGTTNPVFNVDDSVTNAATGLNIQGQAAGGGLLLTTLSSGTNESLTLNAKGSGVVNLGPSVSVISTTYPQLTLGHTTGGNSTLGTTVNGYTTYAGKHFGFFDLTPAALVSVVGTNVQSFSVGQTAGSVNPAFNVNTNTASSATGVSIVSAAAGAGVDIVAISSGTNENISIDGKGSGQVLINPTGTGDVYIARQTHVLNGLAPPAGGGSGLLLSSTANFGVFFGSGAPTISAAQGAIYLRTDGSSTSTRLYVNSSAGSGTTWTNVTTAT